jgi:hypothetical protein
MGNVYSLVLGMVLCFACPLIGVPFLLLGVFGACADDAARMPRSTPPTSAFISGATNDARLLKMIFWTLCICLPLIGVIFVFFAR